MVVVAAAHQMVVVAAAAHQMVVVVAVGAHQMVVAAHCHGKMPKPIAMERSQHFPQVFLSNGPHAPLLMGRR